MTSLRDIITQQYEDGHDNWLDVDYLVRHFNLWLDHAVPKYRQQEAQEKILRAIQEDPGLVGKGWNEIWDMIQDGHIQFGSR